MTNQEIIAQADQVIIKTYGRYPVAFVRGQGATVWDAAGQWRAPNGDLVREPSFVVELVHLVTPDTEARVQRVMADYKRRFAQESVLRLVTNAWAGF